MKTKRNSYFQGAFIATIGIVISKILGIIYVIPFYDMIGTTGGALYGYAYNIYSIFLGISTAGVPLAISKIVSEYETLGYFHLKDKVFVAAKRLLTVIGVICYITLIIFAEPIAHLIIGDVTNGNTIEDVTLVIRVISLSILVVPTLSVYRGYIQGHRIITPTSISQVIEQFIRVSIILIACFLLKDVIGVTNIVVLALLGATLGAIISWLYLVVKVKKMKKETPNQEASKDEPDISYKALAKKIVLYSFPFIFGDVCKSLFNSVDTFFVVRTLSDIGYTTKNAETVISVISTWGNKLNMIVIAVATGFMTSLIPNLTVSLVKKDKKDIHEKINKTIQVLTVITLPMTVGLSFLNKTVWNAFYGYDVLGPKVFALSIFTAFVTVFLTMTTTTLLTLKENKRLFMNLLTGLAINAIFDVPLMYFMDIFDKAYLGATISTILGNVTSILLAFRFLNKKYEISFKDTLKVIAKILLSVLTMVAVLYVVSLFIPTYTIGDGKIVSFLKIGLFMVIGLGVYALLINILGVHKQIFGENIFKKLRKGRL